MGPPMSGTLREAQEWLRSRVADGERCPCCTQFAKIYKRKITSTSAVALIKLWRSAGLSWAHLPTVLDRKQADEAKLLHWGLLEEETISRPDGGRAGWWRLTALGEAFVGNLARVPKYCLIYDSKCLGLDGPLVSITDCLGDRFDYAELMALPGRFTPVGGLV